MLNLVWLCCFLDVFLIPLSYFWKKRHTDELQVDYIYKGIAVP